MQKIQRAYLRVLEELGVELVASGTTAKSHYRFVVTYKGNSYIFIGSNSPSDTLRTVRNFRGDVMRWMRSVDAEEGAG